MDKLKTPGVTLPKERYISAEFLALEAQRLWPRVWQVACREEDIPAVGDFVEYTILDQSILVVRAEPGRIKAFHNACQHRGNQLKQGRGNSREIRCRYHAWRWNLDGSIKDVPDAFDFDPDCMTNECLALPEVLVGTWGGFVFINMDRNAESLEEFLGPIPERLAKFEFDKMRTSRFRTTVMAANWKTVSDAFNEAYHVAGTHPQVLRYQDETGYVYEQHGVHSVFYPGPDSLGKPSPRLGDYRPERAHTLRAMIEDVAGADLLSAEEMAMIDMVVDMAKDLPEDESLGKFFANMRRLQAQMQGLDFSEFSDDEVLVGEDWNIFPNINTPSNAGNAFIFRFRPNGFDPHSSLLDIWSLQRYGEGKEPEGKPQHEFYENWRDHDSWGRLLVQDFMNIPNIQKGMRSEGFSDIICGRQEANIVNFHRALLRYVEETPWSGA